MSNTDNAASGVQINVAYLVKMVLKKWWAILLSILLFGAAGFGFAEMTKTVTYSSNISFVVTNRQLPNENSEAFYSSSDLSASITMANTYKYILQSRTMCEKVSQACSYQMSAGAVKSCITMNVVANTNIITMTITTGSAAKSYDLAMAVVNHYKDIVEKSGYPNSSIAICEYPIAAERPNTNVSVLMYFMVGAFAGAMVAIIIIMIQNTLRNTIHSVDDIKNRLDVRILGVVGKTVARGGKGASKNLLMNGNNTGFSFVETFKVMRTKIESVSAKNRDKVFMVTSAGESEGKTTVSVNLAISLAQNGHSVLLIDADLRKPSVCKFLGMTNARENKGHGLEDVLSGGSTMEQAIRYVERHKIFLLGGTASVADPSEMLSMPQMDKLLRTMRTEFDYVLIDTAPAGVVTDASVLANQCRFDLKQLAGVGIIVDEQLGNQVRVGVIVAQRRRHIKVAQRLLRFAVQIHFAVDTGQKPHILVFQIGAVGIAVYDGGQLVFAGSDKRRHVKFMRRVGALRIAHAFAVDPHLKPGLDRAEVQENLSAVEKLRQGERCPVGGDFLVLVVNAGNLLRVDVDRVREGVRIIPGLGVVLLELPHARDGDLFPAFVVIILVCHVDRQRTNAFFPKEFPGAVQRKLIGAFATGARGRFVGIRHRDDMTGFFVFSNDLRILPNILHDFLSFQRNQLKADQHQDHHS